MEFQRVAAAEARSSLGRLWNGGVLQPEGTSASQLWGVAGVQGAAAALLVVGAAVVARVRARAHEQPDDLVTLLNQQRSGYGAIHSSAHGGDNNSLTHNS